MKIGVSLSIDVTKIDKNRLHKGEKGQYLNCTVFIDPDNPDKFGKNGIISEDVSKEERQAGTNGTILGNAKVFWKGESKPAAAPEEPSLDALPF